VLQNPSFVGACTAANDAALTAMMLAKQTITKALLYVTGMYFNIKRHSELIPHAFLEKFAAGYSVV